MPEEFSELKMTKYIILMTSTYPFQLVLANTSKHNQNNGHES